MLALGLYLEGLVGTEHWRDLVPTVGAPYSAELAHQPLACLTVVGHLFLVVWTHQTLEVQRTVKQSARGVWKGADLPAIDCWREGSIVPSDGEHWH